MFDKLTYIMAYKQNWAKLTPWLGIITAFLLFKYIDYKDVRFWALVNIPLYMFHQMEEHYLPGGFKKYFNQIVNKLPPGVEILTDIRVFWINILLVWLAFIVLGALAFKNIGFGLLIITFSIMNCILHIIQGIKYRRWNPGLVVASFQFLVSIYASYYISINGKLSDLIWWWLSTVLISIVLHLVLFKIVMTRN